MSYIVTKYPEGTFAWADFFSTDMTASKEFFSGLFGWTSVDIPTGKDRPDYTIFSLDGHQVAGGGPTFMPKMPSFWSNYISVNDVDKYAKKIEELGGKVVMPPMDVLESGRMATFQDPTGANLSLWQPKSMIGASIVNTYGAMSWNELMTKDPQKAQEFYGKLFGWTFQVEEEMGGYVSIYNNGRANGGIFTLTDDMEGVPPCWMVYFSVENLEKSLAKVEELGGKVHMSKELPVGKLGMIADPTGLSFYIMEPVGKPEEWAEKQ